MNVQGFLHAEFKLFLFRFFLGVFATILYILYNLCGGVHVYLQLALLLLHSLVANRVSVDVLQLFKNITCTNDFHLTF